MVFLLLVLQNRVANGSDQSEAEFCRLQDYKVIARGNSCKCIEESLPMILFISFQWLFVNNAFIHGVTVFRLEIVERAEINFQQKFQQN